MGALEDGTEELIAVTDGYRKSTQSWRELLQQLKRQGLTAAPKLAVGAAELLARPVMDFHDLRRQILLANQPSRTAAGFRSRSVPAWDWDRCSPSLR
jgi:hypothetical protein